MGLLDNIGGLLGGIFGHSEKPYDEYSKEYQNWINRAQGAQQPYANAGANAIPAYQEWLSSQKNPTEFINKLMGGYSESPFAHNQQQQALRAGQNIGSATGLTGSTALAQQLQQNAGQISSADQNQWLQNVLGINTQYGQGQGNLIGVGQNATNALTNLYGNAGQHLGEAAYGSEAGKQHDLWSAIAHGLGIFGI
jgi:hypothetical protein